MNPFTKGLLSLYPEVEAGGFTRADGTLQFYQRVRALTSEDSLVLDIGAGRGRQLLDQVSVFRSKVCRLQGSVKKIVGIDVDDAVLNNPFLDEAHVISNNAPLPFENSTFDLIYADWVLEHVSNPEHFASEVARVLKPGGWFCARTPNKYGFIGLATNSIPNQLHKKILKNLQPERDSIDVFDTCYKLNCSRSIRRYFPRTSWSDFSYITNPEPPYVQRSALIMRLLLFYWRLTPEKLHTVMNVFLQKHMENLDVDKN